MQQIKSAILLSGGMDSIAIAYWQRPEFSFTIDYGQKAAQAEIQSAVQVSKALHINHHIIKVDCSALGSGDMNNSSPLKIAPVTEWWPYRNQLLITLACMKGIGLGVTDLIVGSVSTDGSHKDGTKFFYEKIADVIRYQEGNINILYPAINYRTSELIQYAKVPTSLLLWAHSCHQSNEPCMVCNGCKKYLMVLQELGIDHE